MMSRKKFVYRNIPIKKISYRNQGGIINVKVYDCHWNLVYQSQAKLNNERDMKRLFRELRVKGVKYSYESSWY